MDAGSATAEAVARLDAEVRRLVADRERATLAFSGGLGSLLVAALVRKRCDLRCVVVGFRGSADIEAALVAKTFLDYPVAVLRPNPKRAWQIARDLRSADPRLSLHEVLALVPLALVEERHTGGILVSGFGLTASSPALRRALASRRASCPGLRLRFNRATRVPLVRMAEAVGIPESFVRAAPRTPPEGSGIGPALRAMAHSQRMSVARLVAADV